MEQDFAARLLLWHLEDDSTPTESVDDSSESEPEATPTAQQPAAQGRRRVYTNAFKLSVVRQLRSKETYAAVARLNNVSNSQSLHQWKKKEEELEKACETAKMKSKVSLGGQGRPEIFPDSDAVVQWVKEMRRVDFRLKASHVIVFLLEDFSQWTAKYLETKRLASLHRLVQRLVHRHGFAFRRPSRSILSSAQLHDEQQQFAKETGAAVRAAYPPDAIFNADEAGVYFDDVAGLIIAERRRKKAAKVCDRSHSYRATVVLEVAASGKNLRPLIIFKAKPGGSVEKECKSLPAGAAYAGQGKTWMDTKTWHEAFIEQLWGGYIAEEFPSALALYVDNLRCHVSEASVSALADYGTEVVPLPKNTTSVLQPLDVGVMGPFKQRLRTLALNAEIAAMRQNQGRPLRERLLAIMNMPAAEKRKEIAGRVIEAWESISSSIIESAFTKAGL